MSSTPETSCSHSEVPSDSVVSEVLPEPLVPTQETVKMDEDPVETDGEKQSISASKPDTDNIENVHNKDMADRSMIDFHIDSDTVINVSNQGGFSRFKVASGVIAAASPVWRALLYGQSATTRPSQGEWTVEMTGDTKALETLFCIAHFKFSDIPSKPMVDELYHITLLTSKYKCTHIIYPWAEAWVGHFRPLCNNPTDSDTTHKLLWIGWELGDVKVTRAMADNLICTSVIDTAGLLASPNGTLLQDKILPPGLLDQLAEIRIETIAGVFDIINAAMKHRPKKANSQTYCKTGKDWVECETMMIGSAIQSLMDEELWPLPEPAHYCDSLLTLQTILGNMKMLNFVGRGYMPHHSHDGCNLGFAAGVEAKVKSMPLPLVDEHMEHLAVQAHISGVENGLFLKEYKVAHNNEESPSISPTSMKEEPGGDVPVKSEADTPTLAPILEVEDESDAKKQTLE